MALSASSILEVRSTGSDQNSGGFVTGASGTDWSQQNAAQYSVTDGVTVGTTTITSATANFGTDVVGNLIYVQGGTAPITADWYQVTVRTNSTTITVDRSTGLTAGTGATLKIGGSFATIAPALALMTVSGMTMYVKNTATYTIGTALTWPAGPNYGAATRMIGYTTTRGDQLRAIIKVSAAVAGVIMGQSGCSIENFELDGNSQGTQGLALNGGFMVTAYNIWSHHWTAEGITGSSSFANLVQCEINNCAGTTAACVIASGSTILRCYSHDNTKSGFHTGAQSVVVDCVAANNSGASSDGFTTLYYTSLQRCVAYNNGRHGMNYPTNICGAVSNCIFVNNAGFGAVVGLTGSPVLPWFNFNAFYNNTSGARSGIGVGADDVALTGVPFTNAAGADYSLNNTAGQGAALRSLGSPGTTPFGTGYSDIGPLRHQDPTGGIYPIFD